MKALCNLKKALLKTRCEAAVTVYAIADSMPHYGLCQPKREFKSSAF